MRENILVASYKLLTLFVVIAGVLDPKNIWVSARTEKTLEYWKKLGTATTLNNSDIVNNCDLVFIAVKPQMLQDAFQSIKFNNSLAKIVFVSMLVGVTLKVLRSVSNA